jgi:hypothetical protein
MSVQPGQHNITVQRRADYDLQLQFKDSAGVGINLTGWTAYAQIWDQSRATKLFSVYGSIDATNGHNSTLGVKLAKNGTAIDATESRAFTGSGAQEAKLVTSWIIELDSEDEVSLFIANHSGTSDLVLKRGRLVASEIFA